MPGAAGKHAGHTHPTQLSPLLVWAVVFCDIGTFVYYVPGILYAQVGALTPLFITATVVGFILKFCKKNRAPVPPLESLPVGLHAV